MHKGMIKRLIIAMISTAVAANSHAVAEGFYMGVMTGPATNGGGQQNVQVLPLPTATNTIANKAPANPKSSQFGSRLYLGYKFLPIVGWELGFTFFSGVNYILKSSTLQPAGGTTLRVRTVDLVGKIDYAFRDTIGLFGKAGVMAAYVTTPAGLNVTNYHVINTVNRAKHTTGTEIVNSGSNTYKTKLAPTLTIGASYDFNQNWVADISWTRDMVGGVVSNMDLYALGISYHFVDKYCGQFLC